MDNDPLLKELGYTCIIGDDACIYFVRRERDGRLVRICEFRNQDSIYRVIYSDISKQLWRWKNVEERAKKHNANITKFVTRQNKNEVRELAEVFQRYFGTVERVRFNEE